MKNITNSPLKRALDLFLSCLALFFLWPILLIVAIAIDLKMGSPVLFTQVRPGLKGRPFRMYKFRTMKDSRDSRGRPLPDDKRITRLGEILRSTSLDELPELINVIRGEMSLVGPRPLLMDYLPLYSERQAKRHDVKPGVTGWAQINGRNAITWERKFDLDLWYIEHWSFLLDVKIIVKTITSALKREGISAEGHATMPAFTGKSHDRTKRD